MPKQVTDRYGSPQFDSGKYVHWNHAVLPHWDARVREQYKAFDNVTFTPPTWLHSPFYPMRGPYSSRDPSTLLSHFTAMKTAGIDVAVLSWTGRGERVSDTQGVSTDDVFPVALEAAMRAGIAAAVHLEPYSGRSPGSVRDDLEYLIKRYGDRLLRACGRPVVYVYDAYHSPDWSAVFCAKNAHSVRGTMIDALVLATYLERGRDDALITDSCFDGLYTYFATDGFTYGSTRRNWRTIVQAAKRQDKLVSLSVGPGYNDTRIRPWNDVATRDRQKGKYFRDSLMDAINARPHFLSITSFNEWGEGTQIEEAALSPEASRTHLDYDGQPALYLDILAEVTTTSTTWRSVSQGDDL